MKKIVGKFVLPVLVGSFIVLGVPSLVSAHEEDSFQEKGIILDENLLPVSLDDSMNNTTKSEQMIVKSATGFHYKTISHSIKKISTKKIKIENHNKSYNIGIPVGPLNFGVSTVPIGRCQLSQVKANVTVKVKKYENGSGKYVGTYTYTSNGASYKEHKKIK
ncbi:hypothetical protein JI641_09820 [Listeria ivanovii subsp. londoniensis]|uniref:LMxysn_1693 family intestinal colonization protein n=1 Tax=Listeria ivanovii TaxID=1638 RepID=UPI001908DFF0|nr:hypothetical protein [Listeria ivanovii]MBK2003290.1 hypothetical protein [Listeria ivanovii subsp. londoniensis]